MSSSTSLLKEGDIINQLDIVFVDLIESQDDDEWSYLVDAIKTSEALANGDLIMTTLDVAGHLTSSEQDLGIVYESVWLIDGVSTFIVAVHIGIRRGHGGRKGQQSKEEEHLHVYDWS